MDTSVFYIPWFIDSVMKCHSQDEWPAVNTLYASSLCTDGIVQVNS